MLKRLTHIVLMVLCKLGIFFAAFLAYHMVGCEIFPVDEASNTLTVPTWYPFVGIGLAGTIAAIFPRKKRPKVSTSGDIEPVCSVHKPDLLGNQESLASRCAKPHDADAVLSRADAMDGHSFEHWCANVLRHNGFYNVIVTRGSGDQGVDITAEKEGVRYAVQCKCYSSDIGNKPVQEVFAGKEMYECQVAAVMTNRHFTQGAKALAEKTRVLLWDREKLLEMVQDYDHI